MRKRGARAEDGYQTYYEEKVSVKFPEDGDMGEIRI